MHLNFQANVQKSSPQYQISPSAPPSKQLKPISAPSMWNESDVRSFAQSIFFLQSAKRFQLKKNRREKKKRIECGSENVLVKIRRVLYKHCIRRIHLPIQIFKVQGFTAKGLNKYSPIYNWHLKALVSKDPIQWHQSQPPDYDHFMRRGGNFTPVSFLTFMAVEISPRFRWERRLTEEFILISSPFFYLRTLFNSVIDCLIKLKKQRGCNFCIYRFATTFTWSNIMAAILITWISGLSLHVYIAFCAARKFWLNEKRHWI